MTPDIPHLTLPIRVENGTLATVEQDGPEHLADRVYTVLAYRPGQRLDRPDFGLPQQAMRQGGADQDEIRQTVERFEPDAVVLIDRDPAAAARFTT